MQLIGRILTEDFVITRVRCNVNSNFEMSNATATCTGCSGFNDSVNLLRDLNQAESPWCVHILSVMKAYECILVSQEARERDVLPSINIPVSTFQEFIQRCYNDRRTCIAIRMWGEKSSFLVLAPEATAYSENVPTHSVCVIRNVSPSLRLISCSNVTCRKGKNKKVKKNKITSDTCCHLRHLLETQGQQTNIELEDSDGSECDPYDDEGKSAFKISLYLKT